MPPLVTLIFDIRQGLYHPTALYTGLDALARRADIILRLRSPQSQAERLLVEKSMIVCLKVKARDIGEEQIIAVDLHDRSDLFATNALEGCDIYLKRSFHRPDIASLPANLANKISPFGLNYACRTHASTLRLLCAAGARFALQGLDGLRHLRGLLILPTVREFEQDPGTSVEPTVVFQTRVWDSYDTAPGEDEAINEGRVGLIRALRGAFGHRFVGGLVPTELALKRYPREVTTHSSKRKQYTAMSKKSLIGIYTRGLHNSTAFKLAECLAASQCIVAEPPRNELPVPLEPGRHFLPFQTPDECVGACRRLFDDQQLANAMRRENHDYYRAEVEPAAHVTRILERCANSHFPDRAIPNG